LSHNALETNQCYICCLQVQRSFAQAITAMAHHRYLELEGGLKLLEFIIKLCSLSDDEVIHYQGSYRFWKVLESHGNRKKKIPGPGF